jgi:peptide/nickel transport system permease protein
VNRLRFIAKRLLAAAVIVIFLIAAMFLLEHMSKLDPAHAYLGAGASSQAVAAERIKLGLNRPILVQFVDYLGHVLTGNFGISYRTRNPVFSDIKEYLPNTIELAVFSLILAVLLGLLLGLASTLKIRGFRLIQFILISGASTPVFLLAYLGILIFYAKLHILPASGMTSYQSYPTGPTGMLLVDSLLHLDFGLFFNSLQYIILPGLSLAIVPALSIGRVLRGSLLTTMRQDFIRTARSKGLNESRVFLRHALRNSIGPALSMIGLQAGLLLASDVVVEQIFSWPGVGYYIAQSIPVGDFPAISGVTIFFGIFYVLINTLVDIGQQLADPRIRT